MAIPLTKILKIINEILILILSESLDSAISSVAAKHGLPESTVWYIWNNR